MYPPCTFLACCSSPGFWKLLEGPVPSHQRTPCVLSPLACAFCRLIWASTHTVSPKASDTTWAGVSHPLYSLARICLPCPLFMTAAPAPSTGLRDHSTFGSVSGRMEAYSGLWDQEPRATEGMDKNIPDRKRRPTAHAECSARCLPWHGHRTREQGRRRQGGGCESSTVKVMQGPSGAGGGGGG